MKNCQQFCVVVQQNLTGSCKISQTHLHGETATIWSLLITDWLCGKTTASGKTTKFCGKIKNDDMKRFLPRFTDLKNFLPRFRDSVQLLFRNNCIYGSTTAGTNFFKLCFTQFQIFSDTKLVLVTFAV